MSWQKDWIDMGQLTRLRDYARFTNLEKELPISIRFAHTDKTLTIFDKYPKAIFHFLVLPRMQAYVNDEVNLTEVDLHDLRSLLRARNRVGKDVVKKVLEDLKEATDECVEEIKQEMEAMYGFTWDVRVGLHAISSMYHIHVHVISSDLVSPALKSRKHYLSFNPKQDFFLDLDDVLEWFESVPEVFNRNAQLRESEYKPRLSGNLVCFRCSRKCDTVNSMKEHLQVEFDKLKKEGKAKRETRERLEAQKRKREEKKAAEAASRVGEGSVATSPSPGSDESQRSQPTDSQASTTAASATGVAGGEEDRPDKKRKAS